MSVQNKHWVNANAGRTYPIDDASSAVDDNGRLLPSGILGDLNIRWPQEYGLYAFVGAVSVSVHAVAVVIQAARAPDSESAFTPLGYLTVRKPVVEGRVYSLTPQVPGFGGWLSFGSEANGVPYSGRFSSPAQSRLCPRAARSYRSLPVRGLQELSAAQQLTGVVQLKADPPLEIVKESREIDGILRDCVVIRLVDDGGADPVFVRFAGPCGGRPETGTCQDPQPVEFINEVGPDCSGIVTIDFRGCANLSRLPDAGGAVLDCELGTSVACVPPYLPDAAGVLPTEYPLVTITPPTPPTPGESGQSDSFTAGELPASLCFTDPGDIGLTTETGSWTWTDSESPTLCPGLSVSLSGTSGSYASAATGSRNVAIWETGDATLYREVTTEVRLLPGEVGVKHNAHLVLNYRPSDTVSGQFTYLAVAIDFDTQTVRLMRFTGTTLVTITSVLAPSIVLEKWYRLRATIRPAGFSGSVLVDVRAESVEDSSLGVSFSQTTAQYETPDGSFGIGSDRALTEFAYLAVDVAT